MTAGQARRVVEAAEGDVEDLPERIARSFVERIEADGPSDPFIAVVRSAGDTDVAKQLMRAMRMKPAEASLSTMDSVDLAQRADMLGAFGSAARMGGN